MKIKLEYIWLDGSNPQQLRSKTKIIDDIKSTDSHHSQFDPSEYPVWSFDGSSTLQAQAGKGKNTDCLLKPVFVCIDPFRGNPNKLILCEVLNPDGTPHSSNHRRSLSKLLEELNLSGHEKFISSVWTNITSSFKEESPWFGWEQEYTLTHKPIAPFEAGIGLPLGFSHNHTPRPQGDYYCGIGADTVVGRDIVEEHMNLCMEIGLDISGINAEVLLGQWEYQIGPVTALNGSDQLWVSRYILQRVAEKHNVNVSLHPKPIKGDWNGTGCHVNFSTKEMRKEGGLEIIKGTMEKLKQNHMEHINVYGLHNEQRLTGHHETSGIHNFSYGFSTRDTSIRIPAQAIVEGKGYFEDRRPASNCDPYQVAKRMLDTVFSEVLIEEEN
jgi:glutamine synthetase